MRCPAACLLVVTAALIPACMGCGSSDDETAAPAKGTDPPATATPAATDSSNGAYGY